MALDTFLDNTYTTPTVGTAFNSHYITNTQNLQNLANKLVTPQFLTDTLDNLFTRVDTYVNRIIMYPCYVPASGATTTFGYYDWAGTRQTLEGVSVAVPSFEASGSPQYSLCDEYITPRYGDFRDYGDRVHIRAFLPYYGFVDVPTNDVMGKYLKVYLYIDFSTGFGVYYVCAASTSGTSGSDFRVLSKHMVKVGIEIPIGKTSNYDVQRDLLFSAVRMAGTAISAAAGSISETTTTISGQTQTTTSSSYSRAPTKGARLKKMSEQVDTTETSGSTRKSVTKAGSASIMGGIVSSSVEALRSALSTASSTNSNAPLLEQYGTKVVLIVVERPVYTDMGDYAKLSGKPLCEVRALSAVHGYTEISELHLEGFTSATGGELSELKSLLSSGIILP